MIILGSIRKPAEMAQKSCTSNQAAKIEIYFTRPDAIF
jgi:hypothetical protein